MTLVTLTDKERAELIRDIANAFHTNLGTITANQLLRLVREAADEYLKNEDRY